MFICILTTIVQAIYAHTPFHCNFVFTIAHKNLNKKITTSGLFLNLLDGRTIFCMHFTIQVSNKLVTKYVQQVLFCFDLQKCIYSGVFLSLNSGNGPLSSVWGINVVISNGPRYFRFPLKGAEPQQVATSTPLPGLLRGLPLTFHPPVIIMLRAVFLQALPRVGSPAVRRYSAAAIPVPNTQPEVHFNKVSGAGAVSLQRRR